MGNVCSRYPSTTGGSVWQWCDVYPASCQLVTHVYIRQGQCDERQPWWTKKLRNDRIQHWTRQGTHTGRHACKIASHGIWPSLYSLELCSILWWLRYSTVRSTPDGCLVRLQTITNRQELCPVSVSRNVTQDRKTAVCVKWSLVMRMDPPIHPIQ